MGPIYKNLVENHIRTNKNTIDLLKKNKRITVEERKRKQYICNEKIKEWNKCLSEMEKNKEHLSVVNWHSLRIDTNGNIQKYRAVIHPRSE
jgi:hypothetical protein